MGDTMETFNDGILHYGTNDDLLSDKKKLIGKKFVEKGTLYFRKLSIREQDQRIAEMNDRKIDMKVKTLYPSSLRETELTDFVAKINNQIYEFSRVDHDNNHLYLYLAKVGAYQNE